MKPVTWSPDGCCLAFVAEETLYVYHVQADGQPVPIFTQPGLHRLFANWSPTGRWIAVASDANPQDTASPAREYIYWLISPDGNIVRNLGQYPVAGYGAAPYNLDWSPDGKMFVTPSQCLISAAEESAICRDEDTSTLTGPAGWLPRAWTRSFLSWQFAAGDRPPFYTRSLSPGGRQIAYSLYDAAAQQSDLYVFDRSTGSYRQLWTVSGYVINEIRWTKAEEFLVVGLGDPGRAVEGGPVILLVDTSTAGSAQILAEGENLYLIDVIPNHPVAEAAPTPGAGLPTPVPTPVSLTTGPVVSIPGSGYGVVPLGPLEPPACCLAVAPAGDRLAFTTCRTMIQKIYVQNVGVSDLKEISRLRIQDGDGPRPDPAWSPDGRQLAFANYDYGLYVIDADGTHRTQLEPAGHAPAWSPDGQQLAFTVHHSQKGLAIGVMKLDGSQLRLLTGYEARDQQPAWSPDGQQIAFVSDRDGNREIYLRRSDGRNQRRLTHHEGQDWGPVWSPDGRHIVFTSDRNGQAGIFVINSDGTDERWLMAAGASGRWPVDRTRVSFVGTHR